MNIFNQNKFPWLKENKPETESNGNLRQIYAAQLDNPIYSTSSKEKLLDALDTSGMTLKEEIEARYDILNNPQKTIQIAQTSPLEQTSGMDENEKRYSALEYANKVKQSTPARIDIENAVIKNDNSLSPLQKIGKMTWNNFKNFNPGIRMGEAAGELAASKEEMVSRNEAGYDNYAHRYGMYTNAKDGLDKAVYTLCGGVLKETKDIYDKSIKGNKPLRETLLDSYKDMKNNIEGVYEATKNNLQGNDVDGRLWLSDFDYLHNKWRPHRRK